MDINTVLKSAMMKVLRPIARLMLRHGISHVEFSEMSKQAFVLEAYHKFALPKRKKSMNRTAILTGLSRKEVARVMNIGVIDNNEKKTINRAVRVIGGWLQDAEFLGEDKQPKLLSYKGENNDFERLVKKYSGDISARALLDELRRNQSVTESEEGLLELVTGGYIPSDDELDKLRIMGVSIADLIHTINFNMESQERKRFQRQVIYSDIPEHLKDEFEQLNAEKSMALLIELNKWLAEHRHEPGGKPETIVRLGVGIYYIEGGNQDD